MKKVFFILCGISVLFGVIFSPHKIFAASLTLTSNQTQVGQDDEYNVNVLLSIGSANGTQYFLRGTFYQSGTTNYCGYTYNGSAWYNGPYTTNNGWQNLLPITVQNSSWSGTLKVKLDTSDAGCMSSGTYNFKIQRFTISGSGTFDSQNEQTLSVVIPTPTSTPTPTAVPTPTPTTVSPNTHTPAASPTQKPINITIKPTVKITFIPVATVSSSLASISGAVLGSSMSPTLVDGIAKKEKTSVNLLFLSFCIGSIFLLSSCGILLYYWKKGLFFHGTTDK